MGLHLGFPFRPKIFDWNPTDGKHRFCGLALLKAMPSSTKKPNPKFLQVFEPNVFDLQVKGI